jgi:serpin B
MKKGIVFHPGMYRIADFSVKLFRNVFSNSTNTLISPTSLLAALIMAQHGARGLTQLEMESVLGADADQIGDVLSIMYSSDLGIDERIWNYKTVRYANAVWLCDDGRVQFDESYLHTCKEKSHAEIIKGAFDDAMVSKINDWAAEKTGGAIPNVVDSLPADQVMLLMSALAFNGQWETPYGKSDIIQHPFTTVAGTVQNVDCMKGEENVYLIDDEARGFIKPYKDGRYAFAALVPDKGIAIGDFVAHLTGERLLTILERAIKHKVDTLFPKFEIEQRLDLREPLMQMGLTDAFDQMRADFTGIGVTTASKERLYIGNVWQNNKIQINEEGTKAYSITGLDTLCYSCIEQKPYKVYLDRPFLYMIIDQKTSLPLFMGTVTNL